jgi:twitching motility protein PilT
MPSNLNDLPFIDLYVRLDRPDQALFRSKEKGKSHINQVVPADFQIIVDRFSSAVNAVLGDRNEGVIEFDGVRCRLSRQKLASGSTWVCARRVNTVIPNIDALGFFPIPLVQHMKSLGAKDGLILLSGATGAGKTTTGVALLAHYLNAYGGTAVTVEDPVEYMLEGRHGKNGHCFQVEIQTDDEWAVGIKRSLRWAPHYIFVGEIRTPKAAEQLLRAATTGHLVISTLHASSLEEALMGLIFLAEQSMGPGVQNILSAGLAAVVHQTMKDTGPTIKYLYTEHGSASDPVRSIIRENKIGALGTYIDRAAVKFSTPVSAADTAKR